ncbi:MAG: hypothetical protein IPP78_08980 [Holophagaceae bacterium]|nr:hypothetical protein [Holophagaceae bacterium]
MIWLLPALALSIGIQAEPAKPPLLEFLSASLTNGPGIQPQDGKVDPGFPYFSGGVAWHGRGKLTRGQIRLYLLDVPGKGRTRARRLALKAWEPADPLNPEQWRFKSAWPGGAAEGRKVRVVVLRRGRTWAQVEGLIREISLPSASPRSGKPFGK